MRAISDAAPLVVGIGGTMRPGPGTERVLRAALAGAARALVERIARGDGVTLASPAYHGGVSGFVKNALDHVEELRDSRRPYLDGRAVGCIACAGGWQAAAATLAGLRSIVHALRGWPTPLGVALNTSEPVFGPDGA